MLAQDRYDSLIQWHWNVWSRAYGPDPFGATWQLAKCQVRAESAFNPFAVSKAGAVGLMQLMAATATELGVRDRTDPEQSLRGGIEYLWKQWALFRLEQGIERWKFALGAYNAGAGSIVKAQTLASKRGLAPSEWTSIERVLHEVTGLDDAPETCRYVARIVGDYQASSTGRAVWP